jgi:glutamate-1-semialdehyde 2,1-aminomutase
LIPVLADAPLPAQLVRIGSIFWIALHAEEPPRRAESIDARAAQAYATVFHGLLEHRVALAPSAYEVGFLSLAHTNADIDRLAAALFAVLGGSPQH